VVETFAAGRRQWLWRQHADAVNAELVARWLPADPVSRVLKTDLFDEAVGAGLYPCLSARARVVTGIDVSPAVVNAATARYPGLDAKVADVRRLPFEPATFNAIVSNSTLDHFDSFGEIKTSVGELHRVLAPRGDLLLTLDNARNPIVALRGCLPGSALRWIGALPAYVGETCGPRALRRLLESTGFEVYELTAVLHCPRAPAVAAARLFECATRPTRQRFLKALAAW